MAPARGGRQVALFGPRGALLSSAPSGPVESDTFTSDPQKPVPYIAHPGTDIDAEYMIDDQRFATRRPDVLVYTSPVLTEDVTLAGPVDASPS